MMTPEGLGLKAERLLKVLQVITLALLAAVFLYPLLVAGMLAEGRFAVAGVSSYIIHLGTLFSLTFLFFAWRGYRIIIEKALSSFSKHGNLETFLNNWFIATFFAQILREIPAILGIVLSLASGKIIFCVALGLISFIAIGKAWPKPEDLAKVLPKGT